MWLVIFRRPQQFTPDLYLFDPLKLPVDCPQALRDADGKAIDQMEGEAGGIVNRLFAPPDMDPEYEPSLCGWMDDKEIEGLGDVYQVAGPEIDITRIIRTGVFG